MIRHRPRFRSALSGRLLPLMLTLGLSLGLIACNESTPPPGAKVAPAVQQRFQQFDRDNDGRLSPSELNRPRLFQAADRDSDGYVSLQEASDYLQQRQNTRRGTENPAPATRMAAATPADSGSATPARRRDVGAGMIDAGNAADSSGRGMRNFAPEQNALPASASTRDPDDDDGAPDSGPGGYTGSDSGPMRMARAGGRATALDDAPGVRRFLNLPYATLPGVDPNLLSLDLYAPATGQNHPVIVMVHGGGWQRGDKANANVAAQKVRAFVAAGYIFVSVNYRLSPAVKHPAHVQDVAKALAWVNQNIKRYGGNPGRIYLMGHSAGAHLAALVATDSRYLKATGQNLSLIKGVILLDGAGYDIPRLMREHDQPNFYITAFGNDERAWREASPITYIAPGKGIPPFLVFYTPRPRAQMLSENLRDALTRAGVPVRTRMINKSHAQINRDVGQPGDEVTVTILDFVK